MNWSIPSVQTLRNVSCLTEDTSPNLQCDLCHGNVQISLGFVLGPQQLGCMGKYWFQGLVDVTCPTPSSVITITRDSRCMSDKEWGCADVCGKDQWMWHRKGVREDCYPYQWYTLRNEHTKPDESKGQMKDEREGNMRITTHLKSSIQHLQENPVNSHSGGSTRYGCCRNSPAVGRSFGSTAKQSFRKPSAWGDKTQSAGNQGPNFDW